MGSRRNVLQRIGALIDGRPRRELVLAMRQSSINASRSRAYELCACTNQRIQPEILESSIEVGLRHCMDDGGEVSRDRWRCTAAMAC